MANDGFEGLTLSYGGQLNFGLADKGQFGATAGGYVTAFGGRANNGLGVFGTVTSDRANPNSVTAPTTSLELGTQATLTFGNVQSFQGRSGYFGAHIGVVGVNVGVPISNPS